MKNIISLFLFQIFIGTILNAQSEPFVVKSFPRGSVPEGILPSPNSKAYKQSTPYVSVAMHFFLYMESSVNGETQQSIAITERRLNQGERVIFEIVPEVREEVKLLIVFNFPGFSRLEHKATQSGNTFKWIEYQSVTIDKVGDRVPLMIIYEDSTAGVIEKQLDIITKNKTLLPSMNSSLEKKILSILKTYHLIAYTLSKPQEL